MWKFRPKSELVVMMFVLVVSLYSPVSTSGSSNSNIQVAEAITKVRGGRTVMDRTEAARNLVELTRKIDSTQLDHTTLENLVSLLDSPEDSVRFWVAAALGNLGPRARIKLLEVLAEVDCVPLRGLNSAAAIEFALKKIGVTRPPWNCKGTVPRVERSKK
jgi:HEAT repeat protein